MSISAGKAATLSLVLMASLLLVGCTATTDSATQSNGPATTQWRAPEKQKPIDPNSGTFVDRTDTSRQDGPKEVKFITLDALVTNSVTGKVGKANQETVFRITASTVKALGPTPSSTVFTLANVKNKQVVQKEVLTDADQYEITLTIEYVSGYTTPGTTATNPLFWPVTNTGSLTSVAVQSSQSTLAMGSNTLTLVAVTAAGAPAPIGVRYMQLVTATGQYLNTPIDVFAKESAVITPRS